MKKEVIIFLVVALMISAPAVSADNLLTGFSFVEDVGGFFGKIIDFFKGKTIVGGGEGQDPETITCGDGKIEGEEQCEEDFEEESNECASLEGFNGGELKCYPPGHENECTFDIGECYSIYLGCDIDKVCIQKISDERYKENECENNRECITDYRLPGGNEGDIEETICGNDIKEGSEQCDGDDFDETCMSFEYGEGNLDCDENCRFDTSGCAYSLTIEINPSLESGTVTKEVNEENIKLTANPNSGYDFKRWSGDSSSIARFLTINLNKNKILTANFVKGETICNDNKDNDNDGLTDCADNNCQGRNEEFEEAGYKCNGNKIEETNCEDEIDNDKDDTIDSLDKDCEGSGLQITGIDFEDDEFWEHSKISIIDCSYEITPSINYRLVKDCMNLTINERKMECKSKISQNYEDETKGYVQFKGCDVGSESEDTKVVKCEVWEKCKEDSTQDAGLTSKEIYVNEFNICEKTDNQEEAELQEERGLETFTIFTINKPNERDSFEIGETIEIKTKVKNRFIDENNEQSSIEAKVEAVLVKTSTFEEITSTTSEEIEIAWTNEKIIDLEIEIPGDLESGNYRIYAKVYRDGYEDEICRSKSIGIKIGEEEDDDDGTECEIDEDNDDFCAENNEDCDDENPEINPGAIEICNDGIDNNCDDIIDFADRRCETTGSGGDNGGGNGDGRDNDDEDNDGLPDYWEYNHFNNLNQNPYDDPDNDGILNIDEFKLNKDPNVPNKKGDLLWLWILLGIILVGAIIFFVIKLMKQPKKLKTKYSLNQSNKIKIQQFIQKAKTQGMNRQQIKNSLINAGWKQKDVKKFL